MGFIFFLLRISYMVLLNHTLKCWVICLSNLIYVCGFTELPLELVTEAVFNFESDVSLLKYLVITRLMLGRQDLVSFIKKKHTIFLKILFRIQRNAIEWGPAFDLANLEVQTLSR